MRVIDGGCDAEDLVSRMFCAQGREAGLDGGIGFVQRRLGHRRRRKGDGGIFRDDDLASALLVNFSAEDVLGGDDERGFGWLGRRRHTVLESAAEAGGRGGWSGGSLLFCGKAEC